MDLLIVATTVFCIRVTLCCIARCIEAGNINSSHPRLTEWLSQLTIIMVIAEIGTANHIVLDLNVSDTTRWFWGLSIAIVLVAGTSLIWAAILLFLYHRFCHL